MEKKDNILLAFLAGIGGTLLGGIIYYIVTKIGFIAYISSIAGVFLSLTFFSAFKKFDKKTIFPVAILFMILNLLMIFVVDAIIFAQQVGKMYGVPFMEAFREYPNVLKTQGLYRDDYLNIIIVVLGTAAIAYSMYKDIKEKEALARNSVIDNDEDIYDEYDDEDEEI